MGVSRLALRLLMGRRLPTDTGTLTAGGARDRVVIRRDGFGIPHIEAENEHDAWYGLGFCQGQDRAFMLETMLRAAHGTTAEVAGRAALPIDRLSRRLGFLAGAIKQLDSLDTDVREMFEAFALGVTEGATIGCERRAHEFALLRIQPTPWTAADALAVSRLQSFASALTWEVKLARHRILREDGPDALRALEPYYPSWQPVNTPPGASAGEAMDRVASDLAAFGEAIGTGGASNAWAVAPSRTASGRPILANDPHLGTSLPAYWYLAHLQTPDWSLAGACFAGAPLFASAHNGTAGWGVTLGLVDTADLYVEDVGPDGDSVREGDGFVPLQTGTELIRVKGEAEPVEEVVKTTPRGPIIGTALPGETAAISVRATWLETGPVRGLLTAWRARSFDEFRREFDQWPAAPLNVVYADTTGATGWLLCGKAPRRRSGWGTIPLPGWEPDAGWEDEGVDFDEMPHVVSPTTGFVASANNKPAPDADPPYLGIEWADGYRFTRVTEALESRTDWDVESTGALQMDLLSIPWREMSETVLATPVADGDARQALELLREWDGQVSADSSGAAVFELFVEAMIRQVVESKAPNSWEFSVGKGFTAINPFTMLNARRSGFLVDLLHRQQADWLDGDWSGAIERSLTKAVATLRKTRGSNPNRWAWGVVRPLKFRHPAAANRLLDGVLNRGPFPWGGDSDTLAQTASNPIDVLGEPLLTASLRMVLDVGDWDNSLFVLPGGQSGNPLSPNYDDMLPLWRAGGGVPIAWSAAAVLRAATRTLILRPG